MVQSVRPEPPVPISDLVGELDAAMTSGKRVDHERAQNIRRALGDTRRLIGPDGTLDAKEAQAFRAGIQELFQVESEPEE